jgi:hypothetical protein
MSLPITQETAELQTVVGLSSKYGKSDSALKESYRLARQTAQWQDLPTPLSINTPLTETQIAFFEWKYGAVGQTVTRQADRQATVYANGKSDNDAVARQTEVDRQKLETEIRDRLETEIRQTVSKEFSDRQNLIVRQTETDTTNRLRTEYEEKLRTEKAKTAKAVADRQQTEREAADKLRETESKYTQLVESEREKTRLAVSSALSQKELELRDNLSGSLDKKMSDKRTEYATELATERQRIETDYKERLSQKQTELNNSSEQLTTALSELAVMSERAKRLESDKSKLSNQLEEMSARVGNVQTDKSGLSGELIRAQMENASLSERLQASLSTVSDWEVRYNELDRKYEREYVVKKDELQVSYNEEVAGMKERVLSDYRAKLLKEKGQTFFEDRRFSMVVLFGTMLISGFAVHLFIGDIFPTMPLVLAIVGAFVFMCVGLMITVHIGWHKDMKTEKNPLFWFEVILFIVEMFVLQPLSVFELDDKGEIVKASLKSTWENWHFIMSVKYVVFALMWNVAGFYFGQIWMKISQEFLAFLTMQENGELIE